MNSEILNSEFAKRIEHAEIKAWMDMYEAAPKDYAENFQLGVQHLDSLVVFTAGGIPFGHFNCVLNLGLDEPATETQLEEVLKTLNAAQRQHWYIHYNPHCEPANLREWFERRNLKARSAWDRIYRNAEPLSPTLLTTDDVQVEKVTNATAREWAEFVSGVYHLPTVDWLAAFAERMGWHHYTLRKNSIIVAARSMFINREGWAWLGIDAPVPGLMTNDFTLDWQICQRLVKDGLQLGAKHFVADIEAPTLDMDSPAYQHFARLGFKKVYSRANYMP
ncbi:MAG: hypothetical protein AB1757_05390 [Acidobacteriota bacterium]